MNRKLFLAFILFLSSLQSVASHILGGEIGYTYLSGNDYEIYLIIYGDCSGSSFPNLFSSVPRVEIYKDGNPNSFTDLQPFGTLGTEVTPVCPSQAANTTCVNTSGTIPGVAQFIFKNTVTLSGTSTNWKFVFNGSLGGGGNGAGRSNAITNLVSGVTLMGLEATLNNVNGPNNSAYFSTIPTPFFCINTQQEYNQGAIDQDGDQLYFTLVPGLVVDNSGSIVGPVSYQPPYTYSNPLAVTAGSFSFNNYNGQMSFIPNQIQTSLVVNKVFEIRSGDTVGSAMREMSMIVLNNCVNQPPTASIPTSNVGSFDTTRTLKICNSTPVLQFVIQASDPDVINNVTATVSGLPSGATASISGNQTPNPVITITWTLPQPMVPGTYSFYVSCQDDGCPLTIKQTFAYTVILIQPISDITFLSGKESCVPGNDGSLTVNAMSLSGGLSYSIDGTSFQTSNIFSGLQAGTYTIIVKDVTGCTRSADTSVMSSPLPILNCLTQAETCIPGSDGSIVVNANSVNGAITSYSINGGANQVSNIFSNLSSGTYTVSALDATGCIGSTSIQLEPPVKPHIDNTIVNDITCFGKADGSIQLSVSPASTNYSFLIQPSGLSNNNGLFKGLSKGTYTIVVVSDKLCTDTTFGNILEPSKFTITDLIIDEATCDRDNAKLEVQTNKPPTLIYTLWPAIFINTSGMFTDIKPGFYTVNVRDSNFCDVDSAIYIGAKPNLFSSTTNQQDLYCNGWGTEGAAEVIASGGVEPYTYLWSTDPPLTDSRINYLTYGWYFVEVTDATGCAIKDTVYIHPGTCCENIYLPNAFTPNGDGQNDEWKAITTAALDIDLFAVYNRWGEQVWHTKNQRESWDGTRNGKTLETGTYFYTLRYTCLTDGKKYSKKGDLIMLR